MHQGISRGGQIRASVALAMVLNAIDQALAMLHPYTQGKGLGFDQNLFVVQELKNIAGGVAGGQNSRPAFDDIALLRAHAFELASSEHEIGHAGLEMDFSAGLFDALAQCGDEHRQFIGADMRMGVEENVIFGAVRHQDFHDALDIAALLRASI